MNIIDKLLNISKYCRTGEKQGAITKVVIHWVGNANSSAIANRNYFNNLANTHITTASAHYIIGLNGEIIRCIPEDEVAFHAGSYSMNRKSIGIENCHPDWNGKFNAATYASLVELCADILKRYGLTTAALIRHYDVTGKNCPKYYVDNPSAWEQFKIDVKNKMCGSAIPAQEPSQNAQSATTAYQNGSTIENIYAESTLKTKIGSLGKYESCDCLGHANGMTIVRYNITGTNNYKVGFAKYNGKTNGPIEVNLPYHNGSTPETVFADLNLTKKIGSLDKYESCQCLGKFNGKYIVKYKINGTENYKVGFVRYSGGVK